MNGLTRQQYLDGLAKDEWTPLHVALLLVDMLEPEDTEPVDYEDPLDYWTLD